MKKNNNYSKLFVILLIINIVVLLTSNIITSKLIIFWGIVFTAGDLLFPFSYILNDIIVEIYGYQKSKFSIIMSFIANIVMVLFFMLAVFLPYPDYYVNQGAFETVLSATPRILIAGLLAYFIGSIFNSKIMEKLKAKTKKLWLRTIISSVFGEAIDTVIFVVIAFIGTISNKELLSLVLTVYLVKLLVEILFTPILLVIIKKLKQMEGL